MDTEDIIILLLEAGNRAGLRPEATKDYVHRGLEQFPYEASGEAVATWLAEMKPQASHLFHMPPPSPRQAASPIAPEHAHLSVEERLTRSRPPVRKRQRPEPVQLDAKQVADLAGLNPTQRLTQYRALQQQRR